MLSSVKKLDSIFETLETDHFAEVTRHPTMFSTTSPVEIQSPILGIRVICVTMTNLRNFHIEIAWHNPTNAIAEISTR
jgi:hypothetical protein